MQDCIQFIRFAQKYGSDDESIKELSDDLITSYQLHKCTCESVKHRESADKMLQECLNDNENISLEIVWDVIDKYRYVRKFLEIFSN